MGCVELSTHECSKLRLACLNFSGIALSPFQFYTTELEDEQKQLNAIFQGQLESQLRHKIPKTYKKQKDPVLDNFFNSFKSIDKDIKVGRYTPLYDKLCGAKKGCFLTAEGFRQQWYRKWNIIQENLKLEGKEIKYTQEGIQNLQRFDLVCYKAIMRHVYDMSFQKIIESKSIVRYLEFMNYFFDQIFMSAQKKSIQVIKFIRFHKIDVMFVQQATQQLFNAIQTKTKEYRIVYGKQESKDPQKMYQKSNTAIFINTNKFPKKNNPSKSNLIFKHILQDKSLSEQDKKRFMIWEKTAIISIDNFIFLSVHLKKISLQMINDIKKIQSLFPKKYIVIGGLVHNFEKILRYKEQQSKESKVSQQLILKRQLEDILQKFYHYPDNRKLQESNNSSKKKSKQINTVIKRRTMMQTQLKKANDLTQQCHSYILYDQRLKVSGLESKQGVIRTCTPNSQKTQLLDNKHLIPSNQHPFDDYIVFTTVRVPNKIKKKDLANLQDLKNEDQIVFEQNYFDSSSSDQQEDETKERILSETTNMNNSHN